MNRISLMVTFFASIALSSCQKPTWPDTLTRPTDLCDFVATSDYVVKVTPKSISQPRKIEMTPWPKSPFWVTPVEWQLDEVVLSMPVPGARLAALPNTINTYIASAFNDNKSTRFVSLSVVDGELLANINTSFAFDGKSWLRFEDQDPETAQYAFATENDLRTAFQAEAAKPACARIDWVSTTRNGAAADAVRAMEQAHKDGAP